MATSASNAAMLGLAVAPRSASPSPSGLRWFLAGWRHGRGAGRCGAGLGKDVAAVRSPRRPSSSTKPRPHLLRRPLSAIRGVEIALLNNRELQAAYNELGISEAALVKATLPPSPTFSLSDIAGGGAFEFERQIGGEHSRAGDACRPAPTSLATASTRPSSRLRSRPCASRRRRGAPITAPSPRARWRTFSKRPTASAESAAQLSRRLGETGSASKLDQARDLAFYADLTAEMAGARQRAAAAREELVRRLGVWGGDLNFRLPNALPPLPRRPHTLANVEAEAVARRVDLQMARIEVEVLAKSYGLTTATRFINLLDAGR